MAPRQCQLRLNRFLDQAAHGCRACLCRTSNGCDVHLCGSPAGGGGGSCGDVVMPVLRPCYNKEISTSSGARRSSVSAPQHATGAKHADCGAGTRAGRFASTRKCGEWREIVRACHVNVSDYAPDDNELVPGSPLSCRTIAARIVSGCQRWVLRLNSIRIDGSSLHNPKLGADLAHTLGCVSDSLHTYRNHTRRRRGCRRRLMQRAPGHRVMSPTTWTTRGGDSGKRRQGANRHRRLLSSCVWVSGWRRCGGVTAQITLPADQAPSRRPAWNTDGLHAKDHT